MVDYSHPRRLGEQERLVDLPEFVEKYWAQATVAVGACWAAAVKIAEWQGKAQEKKVEAMAAERVARMDLSKFAQEAAAFAVQTLQNQMDRQSKRIEEQDAVIQELQERINTHFNEYTMMVSQKDAELEAARGRIRELEAEVGALERRLQALGIDIPLTFGAHEVVNHKLKPMGSSE
jgi:polyhydroxyalkanoate synthesis regulator phasin